MIRILKTVCRLIIGFIFCSSGTVLAVNSNLGLSPWDVFHQGLSKITGISMGQVSIFVGLIVVIATIFLKLEIGLGTIANMILIGVFMDVISYTKIISTSHNFFVSLLMLLGSLFTMAIGSYLYIGCEMGCGPRDGLMVALVKKTGKPVGFIRSCIELGVLIIGFILGGSVGIGTLITVFCLGACIQLVFKVLRFDVGKIKHKNIRECFVFFNKCING